ncbi:MAG TPA: S8 family serine peptidase [Solirubrobacteraceae bacterium]|nr:S8 family serine peptidase [Solirubrobacteraceae bacterium]
MLATLAFAAVACVGVARLAAPTRATAHPPATAHTARAAAPDYVPGQVIVGYGPTPAAAQQVAHAARTMGVRATAAQAGPGTTEQILHVSRGKSIWPVIAKLRRQPGVQYAVPDYIAHAAGWIPDDPGKTHHRQGWQQLQWNFLATSGIDAPDAWAHMFAVHRAGGKGVVIAVLDTGIAYRNWNQFRKSPDFTGTHFVDPYDFVAGNAYPLDREGHGTFVAGMIAEATNNGVGLTGLAYGAKIMPVRVLDADGNGNSATIARGIRYAVNHGAQVINLSLVFDNSVTAAQVPNIIGAVAFARRHGVVVVAAAGNDSASHIDYPAAAPGVISVGATTSDRCLAGYSDIGEKLDLVAPGGGDDAALPDDPNCHPLRNLPSVHQMTFTDLNSLQPGLNPTRFGFPGTYGTSMAAPAVSATAALVIASGVVGRHPSPKAVLARLEQTATPLGGSQPNPDYGYGLVNAGAATASLPIATPAR